MLQIDYVVETHPAYQEALKEANIRWHNGGNFLSKTERVLQLSYCKSFLSLYYTIILYIKFQWLGTGDLV